MPELFITSGVIKHSGPLELPELAMEVKISWEKQKLMGDLNMVDFIPGKCQSLSIALSKSAKQNASKVMDGFPCLCKFWMKMMQCNRCEHMDLTGTSCFCLRDYGWTIWIH